MTPIISVIVPVYKAENFIRVCIESLLNQTFTNYELILINDGSPDNCGNICEKYAEKDNRIKVIHKKNGGVSSARNAGIKEAKGKFLMFVDSDDWVDIRILEDLLEQTILNNSELTICAEYTQLNNGSFKVKDFSSDKVVYLETMKQDELFELVKTYSIYGPCRKLYSANIIKEQQILFNENLVISEDLIFNLEYLNFINKIKIINKAYYYYRINESSLTHSTFNRSAYKYYSFVCEKLHSFVKSKGIFIGDAKNIITNHFIEGYLIYIIKLIKQKNINKKEKKLLFNQLNSWIYLDFHLNNYLKNKNINAIYKYIIKSKKLNLWILYITLSALKGKFIFNKIIIMKESK